MREQVGVNLWDAPADAICVTTNGCINSNGEAIMGGGIALEAAKRYPDLPKNLGAQLQLKGNHVYLWDETQWNQNSPYDVFTFPTKTHPAMRASTALITRSARELVEQCDLYGYKNIYVPRPGTGLGGLNWDDVRPLLEPIFDDRFVVVTF